LRIRFWSWPRNLGVATEDFPEFSTLNYKKKAANAINFFMESFGSEAIPAPSVYKVELNEVTSEEPPVNCW
jgi:hypothetical protein